MIICPNCKEEIDDDSHYCDQCGQALLYCKSCGRVGMGRRCIHCGGLMVSLEEYQRDIGAQTSYSVGISANPISAVSIGDNPSTMPNRHSDSDTQYFTNNMYVSGVHAQLKYNATTGWSVTDKHSSNGTKLNQHTLQPDVEMSLKTGDILSIANINLQVRIN